MTGPAVLAVDQGTSATKAIAVCADGRVTAHASRPLGQQFPRPGWVEQDPEELWQSTVAALADVRARQPGVPPSGIALSTQRESVVAWDSRTGKPLAPLISWQDRRSAPWCRSLTARGHAEMITARTGLPVDPMFSAGKLGWLLKHHADVREAARAGRLRAGTVDSWLLWRLTGGGEHTTEIGNASRTQLLSLGTCAWDDELLELFDVPRGALPTIRPSTGPFGTTDGVPGLPDGLPVLAVLGDSHAALFTYAAFSPGVVKATLGTGSSVMAIVPAGTRLPAGLSRTIAWQYRTGSPAFAAEGNIASAGSALSWTAQLLGCDLKDLPGLAEQAFAEEAPRTADAVDSTGSGIQLDIGHRGSAAGEDHPVLVPAFNGLGAPYWDRDARALLVGITHATGPTQLARAALESIAFQVADTFALVDQALRGAKELRVDGGASVNDRLVQLQADLIARPVLRSASTDASARGAAYLACVGAGLLDEGDIESLASEVTVFTPTADEPWRELSLSRWRDALARARMPRT